VDDQHNQATTLQVRLADNLIQSGVVIRDPSSPAVGIVLLTAILTR
jgi:hypothetical protein